MDYVGTWKWIMEVRGSDYAYLDTWSGWPVPAAQAQVGITKLFINCFHNTTGTCATEN